MNQETMQKYLRELKEYDITLPIDLQTYIIYISILTHYYELSGGKEPELRELRNLLDNTNRLSNHLYEQLEILGKYTELLDETVAKQYPGEVL